MLCRGGTCLHIQPAFWDEQSGYQAAAITEECILDPPGARGRSSTAPHRYLLLCLYPLGVKEVDWWKKRGHLVHPPFLSSQLKGYLLKEAFLRVLIASSDNWSKKGVQRRRLIGWISSAHPHPGNTSPLFKRASLYQLRRRTDQPLRLPFKKSRVPYQGLPWIVLF